MLDGGNGIDPAARWTAEAFTRHLSSDHKRSWFNTLAAVTQSNDDCCCLSMVWTSVHEPLLPFTFVCPPSALRPWLAPFKQFSVSWARTLVEKCFSYGQKSLLTPKCFAFTIFFQLDAVEFQFHWQLRLTCNNFHNNTWFNSRRHAMQRTLESRKIGTSSPFRAQNIQEKLNNWVNFWRNGF